MENTDALIDNVESKPVETPVIEELPPTMEMKTDEPEALKSTEDEETEAEVEAAPKIDTDEKKECDDDLVPSTEEDTNKSTDEQENATGTNSTVPTATSLSPGRANIPLKEVNESEKDEPTIMSNGTETANSKKRELEQEEERPEENGADHDERAADQTKKMKTNETLETPLIETKEVEINHAINGSNGIEA
jgi:hypothetical protein